LGHNARVGAELPSISRGDFFSRLSACSPDELSDHQMDQLYQHYFELRRWNRAVSLVGATPEHELVERHYGESLAGLRFIDSREADLVDLGTGAGFPGFVLAVARPELRVTLVEARERKWSFLQAASRRAGLSCNCLNARVGTTPVEGLPKEIDWITARAVAVKDLGLSVLMPKLSPRGALLLWVGARDPELPAGLAMRRELALGGADSRRVVEIASVTREEGA
jgi:16S rRNA (guanine527-N7)-methyltransferase